MEDRHISKAVIARLPRYYRYLGNLLDDNVQRISSNDLSRIMKVTASQIRQDLNNFGGFGQQGYGYNVRYLYNEIGKILGLDRTYNMIIIGAGHLGTALANYVKFEKRGCRVIAMFDRNPALKGQTVRDGVQVHTMDELGPFLDNNKVDIVTLTIPAASAVEVAPVVIRHGVKAIWNFAHTDLDVPDDVVVESVHLSESLMQLSYRLTHNGKTENMKTGKKTAADLDGNKK